MKLVDNSKMKLPHNRVHPAVDVVSMTEDEGRPLVVAEAETWMGTPFHENAKIKGAGVSCGMLLYAVYRQLKLIPEITWDTISPQWWSSREEELLVEGVLQCGLTEYTDAEPKLGDVMLTRVGRCFSHSGIVKVWPTEIIHTSPHSQRVTLNSVLTYKLFGNREKRFFTLWPER